MKLGDPIPFDPTNPDHIDSTKFVIEPSGAWYHTLACIEALDTTDPILNIAGLLHDLGKPLTFGKVDSDKLKGGVRFTYFGHDKIGADLVADLCDELKFSSDAKDALVFTTANHMRFHGVATMKTSKVVKLMQSKHFDLLFALSTADGDCRHTEWAFKKTKEVIDRINDIRTTMSIVCDNPVFVDGQTIIDVLNIKPSKLVGDIKTKVNDIIIDEFNGEIWRVDVETLINQVHGKMT